MKYLKEVVEGVQVQITEAKEGKPKEYYIEGCFMQGDIKNRNGRVYPMNTLSEAVEKFRGMINGKRALGELNHPDHVQINPKEASHLITDLWTEGNKIMGRAKILDTPNGKIVKALLDEGVQLGVSSRGFGSLRERNGVREVQSDFTLATVDIVTDPSAPEAFVNPVMESKEFALVEGQIVEVNEETEKAILAKHGFVKLDETVEVVEEVSNEDKLIEALNIAFTDFNVSTTLTNEGMLAKIKVNVHKALANHHANKAIKHAIKSKSATNSGAEIEHRFKSDKHCG